MATVTSAQVDCLSLSELAERHQRTGRSEHLEELLERLDRLLCSRVRRTVTTDQSFDDCYQEARIAALGAIERWRPDGGASLTTFVTRAVDGAMKRYLRDVTWDLHVTRGPKDLAVRVRTFSGFFEADFGRSATIDELAAYAGLAEEQVLIGLSASRAYRAVSIDLAATSGDTRIADQLPSCVQGPEPEVMMDIERSLSRLPEDIQSAVRLYFLEDRTQAEIAAVLGCSQMQVSRLVHRGVEWLRSRAVTTQEAA